MTTTSADNVLTPTQRWVLLLSSLASFIVVLDLLVVATALSTIQRSLGASLADLEWTITAYTLTFAVFLMAAAALGSRYGRRLVFVVGLAVFGLASAGCALASDVGTLVAARAVQGLGAAAVMPMALALLNSAFPPHRRGWAIGIYGSVTGLAAVLGPILGGAVAQGLSWQWIFWVNVPIALAAIPFVLTKVPTGSGPVGTVDLPGLLLGAACCLGLVWGLIRGNDDGWGSPSVLGSLVAGVALGVAFVAWQRRARSPMLPLRLFGSPAFAAGNVVMLVLSAALTSLIFFTAQYFQVSLGSGPFGAGLRLLPWGIIPLLLAPRAGALADRFGEKALVILGLALFTLGSAGLALVADADAGYLPLLAPMTLVGAGFALAVPAVTKSVVSSVALADVGTASGAFSTARQLGGALGVAVTGAVFAATGGYTSAAEFSHGYRPAAWVCAGFAAVGLAAGAARRPAPPRRHLRRSRPPRTARRAGSGRRADRPCRGEAGWRRPGSRGLVRSAGLSRVPAERRTESGRHVGEDLHVVVVLEAERQRESHLVDLAERGVRGEAIRDLGGAAEQVGREQQPRRSLRRRGTRSATSHVLRVPGPLVRSGAVGGDDDQALGDPGRRTVRVVLAEPADVPELDRGEVHRLGGVAGPYHAAGQEVHPVLAGPLRGAQARAAVPHPPPEAGGVRLDPVRVHLDALDAAEVGGRLAAHEVQQPAYPLMAEVLRLGGVRVEGRLHLLVVDRRADTDSRVEPATGEEVHGRQVLGKAQWVLPAHRGDGGTQLDPGRALGSRRQHGDRRGDAELQVPVAQPGAVEAEPLTEFDDLQGRLVTPARIGLVEQPDGQETQLPQRLRS